MRVTNFLNGIEKDPTCINEGGIMTRDNLPFYCLEPQELKPCQYSILRQVFEHFTNIHDFHSSFYEDTNPSSPMMATDALTLKCYPNQGDQDIAFTCYGKFYRLAYQLRVFNDTRGFEERFINGKQYFVENRVDPFLPLALRFFKHEDFEIVLAPEMIGNAFCCFVALITGLVALAVLMTGVKEHIMFQFAIDQNVLSEDAFATSSNRPTLRSDRRVKDLGNGDWEIEHEQQPATRSIIIEEPDEGGRYHKVRETISISTRSKPRAKAPSRRRPSKIKPLVGLALGIFSATLGWQGYTFIKEIYSGVGQGFVYYARFPKA